VRAEVRVRFHRSPSIYVGLLSDGGNVNGIDETLYVPSALAFGRPDGHVGELLAAATRRPRITEKWACNN
jgi:hypothetical protein